MNFRWNKKISILPTIIVEKLSHAIRIYVNTKKIKNKKIWFWGVEGKYQFFFPLYLHVIPSNLNTTGEYYYEGRGWLHPNILLQRFVFSNFWKYLGYCSKKKILIMRKNCIHYSKKKNCFITAHKYCIRFIDHFYFF